MNNNLANIKKSIFFLNKNDCVAIPTETVYGLAANAYSRKAGKKIYALKKIKTGDKVEYVLRPDFINSFKLLN